MRPFKILLLFSFLAMSFTSCKVFQPNLLVPSFNAAVVHDVTDLGKQVEIMYLNMESAEDKSYEAFETDYNNAEMLINSIILRNQVRPKNIGVLRQSILYRDHFVKWKSEHKAKGTLNDSEIRIYKKYAADQIEPLLVSEMSLK